MGCAKLSLDQRLRAAKDGGKPVILPAEMLYCRDFFDALSSLTASSKSLRFYFDKISQLEQEAGRQLPIFKLVTELWDKEKMELELLYRILVEPFAALKRKEDKA